MDPLAQDPLPAGSVRRIDGWAVGNAAGTDFAVSRRCRHQLADLSRGTIGDDGCLVCPWHGSRYDVGTGEMVAGPRGFLGWHGPTPGYTQLVLAYGRRLRLRVGRVRRLGNGQVEVERTPPTRGRSGVRPDHW